ncbi:MAG: tetratricopeptide repeat protein [Acidobacteriota bacterium]
MCCRSLLLTCLWLAGCSRPAGERFERIAIPPFENLSGDPELDAMGRGLADLITGEITGSALSHPVRVDTPRDAPAARPTHILHGYFSRERGRLRVRAVLEDAGRLKVTGTATAEGAPEAGPQPLAGLIAGQLGRRGGQGREAERARLAVREAAQAGGPQAGAPQAQLRALEALSRLTPADGEVFMGIASLRQATRDYTAAVRAYDEALRREPDNPVFLNEAGYARAYAGDLAGATALLSRYRDLRPGDPNALDSLGDVHFHHGRFAEAEKFYLEAYSKSPGFLGGCDLYKAAQARLKTGDVKGAEGLLRRFTERHRAANLKPGQSPVSEVCRLPPAIGPVSPRGTRPGRPVPSR